MAGRTDCKRSAKSERAVHVCAVLLNNAHHFQPHLCRTIIGLTEKCAEGGLVSEVGLLTVSARADVNMTYVLAPGQPSSIEVSGRDLSDTAGLSVDRIRIIDGMGQCGLSEASTLVDGDIGKALATISENAASDLEPMQWGTAEYVGYFCPGQNLAVNGDAILQEHSCYHKCNTGSCTSDDCFCDGYYDGLDDANTNAICGDQQLCENLCSRLYGDCASIDMHTNKPRCFLNSRTAAPHCQDPVDIAQLIAKPVYNLIAPRPPPPIEGKPRPDGSKPGLLVFAPVEIRALGHFKLCFCDSDLARCGPSETYSLEVGNVFVSGIECLLNSGLHRGECHSQMHGGLRCTEPPLLTKNIGALREVDAQSAVDFCRYGPPDETKVDPRCTVS
jgi:hypothetical protein